MTWNPSVLQDDLYGLRYGNRRPQWTVICLYGAVYLCSQHIYLAGRLEPQPIEFIVYDDDLEVYQIGEIMTIWEMKQVERDVRKYLT